MESAYKVVTVEKLIANNMNKKYSCSVSKDNKGKLKYGIGNGCFPEITVTCSVPNKLVQEFNCRIVEVKIHVIWLRRNYFAEKFSGLVLDKSDCELYFAEIESDDGDSSGACSFSAATLEQISKIADDCNVYLKDVIDIYLKSKEKLLDYQLYSVFADKFCYMEVPVDDKIVMCSVGLQSKNIFDIGLMGKLLTRNKEFMVHYAECTTQVYEQLKSKIPSLYERGQLMEDNKAYFLYSKVLLDKRKRYPELVNIFLNSQQEPKSNIKVSYFVAVNQGTLMKEYNGEAPYWMLNFLEGLHLC